jgi:hypothetical protein
MSTSSAKQFDQKPEWKEFLAQSPEFTEAYLKAFNLIASLCVQTTPKEPDDAGLVLLTLLTSSLPDFDDVMTLCSKDAHWGALKLLRCLYEKIVTMKYIAENPIEADAFLDFDAIDWHNILPAIHKQYGFQMSDQSQRNLDERYVKAKVRFKQESCSECGLRKRTTWTHLSMQDMAKRVKLDYLFLETYLMASKYIHATYFGARSQAGDRMTPMYNIIKASHSLALEAILTHQRYFHGKPIGAEEIASVVQEFFQVWKFSDTDFGLEAESAEWSGLIKLPKGTI